MTEQNVTQNTPQTNIDINAKEDIENKENLASAAIDNSLDDRNDQIKGS